MGPERKFLEYVMSILEEIKLQSLALPKRQPPSPKSIYEHFKPHGVEFKLENHHKYSLKRNIVYKLEDEDVLEVLDETPDDMYGGARFIVKLKDRFDEFYNINKIGVRITKRLESEKYWVNASFQGEEIHLIVGDKEDDEGRHVHLILGKSGGIRQDEKDLTAADLLKKVIAITTKDGTEIKATLEMNSETENK
jgi:hypothetical protein